MSAHLEIVETDAGQPDHVRIIADNGEPLLSSENLEHEHDAEKVLLALARLFGAFSPEVLRARMPDGDDEGHLFGCQRAIPVVWKDERTTPEPEAAATAPEPVKAPARPRKTATRKPRKATARRTPAKRAGTRKAAGK